MSVENLEVQLMVWGYACKLFRDDEKALHVDSGKHLIPWMGDDKLLIDRYDGRGALYDLANYEPIDGAWDNMTLEEKEIELKCDQERYRALYEEAELVLFGEEEEKRLRGKYGQVAYSYDDGTVSTCEPPSSDVKSKMFAPPPGLELPPELAKPESMKQHAIIVKTAAFIAQQGSQMEILMRLKQQGNQKFNFLTHGDLLHEYYKFLLNLIKSGSYVPSEADTSCLDEEEPEGDHYLHPSLLPSSSQTDPKNPPPLTRLIISKLIKYIVKNGLIFEEAIRKLEDPRFSFLDSSDFYYDYYREQVTSAFKIDTNLINTDAKEEPISPDKEMKESNDEEDEDRKGTKRKLMPVCFSLKKPKDSESLEVSTALPQEDSTDDDEQQEDCESSPEQPLPPPPPKISKSRSRRDKDNADSSDNIQRERKAKVAQFLKGLKYK